MGSYARGMLINWSRAWLKSHDIVGARGGWTRSRVSRKNAIMALGRANQDVDLSSSLPTLAGLQFQDALEIWQGARAKVKVLCYRNSQIKTYTYRAL